jgi:hypothetical protein
MQPEAFGRAPLQARRTWPGRALKLSTGAFLRVRGTRPVPEEGLVGLERLAAGTAETGRRLRKVEQVREHVQREMSGAQVQQKLSRHQLLIWRPALGEPLYRRLDASQTPDIGERPGDGVALGSAELARRRNSWRADRRGRGRMPAAVAAASRSQPEYGNGERESPCRRYEERPHPDRA